MQSLIDNDFIVDLAMRENKILIVMSKEKTLTGVLNEHSEILNKRTVL